MTARVLVAVPDGDPASDLVALVEESGDWQVVGVVRSAGDVVAALGSGNVDAVVLHEELGPLPVLELARELSGRFPDVGAVLAARAHTPDLLRAALQSGVRAIVARPPSLEELQAGLASAVGWSQAVRARLHRELSDAVSDVGGTMVAVASAKGGVGATTLAVRLAMEAQQVGAHRSVCLVDFDLQAGDVRSLLDLMHRRSVSDLVEVADEIAARQLDDALYAHPSGLRILLPPRDGEAAEDITEHVARQVLGAIKSRFDVVVVDVGAHVSDAAAVATEMANHVVVVTTPDVPALRAANRLLGLWERVQIRKDGITVVVNRASKESEVQPDLVSKVVGAPLARTVVPADFRSLEAATNTGVPERLPDGPLRRAITHLAGELNLVPQPPPAKRTSLLRRADGQVAVETAALLATVVVLLVLLWQAVLTGFTLVLAGHAAREGARQLTVGAQHEQIHAAALDTLPAAWVPGATVHEERAAPAVRVTLPVPLLVPGVSAPVRVSSRAAALLEVQR